MTGAPVDFNTSSPGSANAPTTMAWKGLEDSDVSIERSASSKSATEERTSGAPLLVTAYQPSPPRTRRTWSAIASVIRVLELGLKRTTAIQALTWSADSRCDPTRHVRSQVCRRPLVDPSRLQVDDRAVERAGGLHADELVQHVLQRAPRIALETISAPARAHGPNHASASASVWIIRSSGREAGQGLPAGGRPRSSCCVHVHGR